MNSQINSFSQKVILCIFAILFAGQPAIIGLTLSSYVHQANTVGDFYAAIAAILFLSNALALSSDRFISVQLHRLKVNYSQALRSNYLYLLKFFLTLFILIAVIAILGDLIWYLLFRFNLLRDSDKMTHPVELCFFCIFFFMTANFMASFLRAIGRYNTVVKSSIISISVRLIIFFLVVVNNYNINLQLDPEYNQVFTLIIVIAGCEIIRIFFFSWEIIKHLSDIVDQHPDNIDRSWQQDVMYYFLYSIQYDLILTFIIIMEIFSPSENAPGICGYIFATVRVFQLFGVILHNAIRDSVAKSLVLKKNFEQLTSFTIVGFISMILIMLVMALSFMDRITLYYHIYQFKYFVVILVCITAIKAIIDALFSIVIFTTRKTMKIFTQLSTIIFIIYIIMSIRATGLDFDRALWTFITFYSIFTALEIIAGLLMLVETKRAKFSS